MIVDSKLIRTIGCALLVALVAAPAAFGQDDRPGREGGRGRGRGGFGGGFGMMGSNLAVLASQPAVQEELELSDEKKAAIEQIAEDVRGSFRGGQGGGRERFREIARESEEKVKQALSEEEFKRLQEIRWQVVGVLGAVENDEMAQALGLEDAQREQLREIQQDQREAVRALFQEGADRDQAREKMQELRKQSEEKAMAVLTEQQRTKYKELTGEPFDTSRISPFGGRRGRQG